MAHEPYLRVLTHRSPIDKLYKTFKSPIYVFYLPPIFKVENGKRYQTFKCAAKECRTGGHIVKRNMDTGDATSTSNLILHAAKCFGKEVVDAAMSVKSLHAAQKVMKDKNNLRSGSITLAFQRASQGKETYSNMPATKLEVRANHVCWMCESKRAFAIVNDAGYHRNMKIGRPQQYIPDKSTVSRDVKQVFLGARKHIANILQVSH